MTVAVCVLLQSDRHWQAIPERVASSGDDGASQHALTRCPPDVRSVSLKNGNVLVTLERFATHHLINLDLQINRHQLGTTTAYVRTSERTNDAWEPVAWKRSLCGAVSGENTSIRFAGFVPGKRIRTRTDSITGVSCAL